MLASLSFDPKLTWDSREDQAILQDHEEGAQREQRLQGHENRDEKPA